MEKYIRLETKEKFKEMLKDYDVKHKMYMWDFFEDQTCYIPYKDCFMSLDRAKELGFIEI